MCIIQIFSTNRSLTCLLHHAPQKQACAKLCRALTNFVRGGWIITFFHFRRGRNKTRNKSMENRGQNRRGQNRKMPISTEFMYCVYCICQLPIFSKSVNYVNDQTKYTSHPTQEQRSFSPFCDMGVQWVIIKFNVSIR